MKRFLICTVVLGVASFSALAQPVSGTPLVVAKRLTSNEGAGAPNQRVAAAPSGQSLLAAKATLRAPADRAASMHRVDLSGIPLAKAKRL